MANDRSLKDMARQRDESKAEALLDAALTEAARVGLSGLSIDAIAERAQMASGTVYVYFSGKGALIEALYAQVKLGFSRIVFLDAESPVRLAIEMACRQYLHFCRTHPRELIFLDQIESSPEWRDRVSTTTRIAMRPLVELIEQGKKERIVKDVETQTLIAFLAGGLQAWARLTMDDSASMEVQISQILSLCWSAIAA